MKFKIEIACHSVAFKDWGAARQVRYILMNLSGAIGAMDTLPLHGPLPLLDSNGNTVGEARVEQ